MKMIKIGCMVLAVLVLWYEQIAGDKNIFVTIIAIVVFMYGMMRLSAKTPSKNKDKNEEDVD